MLCRAGPSRSHREQVRDVLVDWWCFVSENVEGRIRRRPLITADPERPSVEIMS